MLNRTIAPEFQALKPIKLLRPHSRDLPGGIKLYSLDGAEADLVRIEWIFAHKGWDGEMPLLHAALAGTLLNGTSVHSAAEIAGRIDFYGAFLNAESGADHTILSLHCLNKQLPNTLPLVKEILTDAIFPQQEIDLYRRNSRQALQVNMEKNAFQARRAFNKAVFGSSNAYGYTVMPADFDQIERSHLLKYYPEIFRSGNCTILVAGKVNDTVLGLIEQLFGNDDWKGQPATSEPATLSPASPGKFPIDKAGALQSAIRLGKPVINRNHTDFPSLQVLNTVLGGYFGARLMANIREDKGYTYGIGSGLQSLEQTGIFFIATEVGVDVREKALEEIHYELKRLREELVPAGELELVRNYMLGSFLGSLDNVFSHADKFKILLFSDLDYDYYDRYFDTIRKVQADELMNLAQRYLSGGFYEVTVG